MWPGAQQGSPRQDNQHFASSQHPPKLGAGLCQTAFWKFCCYCCWIHHLSAPSHHFQHFALPTFHCFLLSSLLPKREDLPPQPYVGEWSWVGSSISQDVIHLCQSLQGWNLTQLEQLCQPSPLSHECWVPAGDIHREPFIWFVPSR